MAVFRVASPGYIGALVSRTWFLCVAAASISAGAAPGLADHPDLYLVGAGALLIYATANQTLGMAALVLQAAGALSETLSR